VGYTADLATPAARACEHFARTSGHVPYWSVMRMKKKPPGPRPPKTIAMSLPASYLAAAAVTFARDWLATVRQVFVPGDPFNTETAHLLVRRTCAALADLHERNAARIVQLALAGAEDADQGLRDLIAERNALNVPLGPALGTYVNIIVDSPPEPRRPRGRQRDDFLANFIICLLIIALRQRFPVLRLRRSSSRHPSLCSIVSAALIEAGLGRGGEEAIRKIWERFGPPVVPGYGISLATGGQ
jgi:hypothetical protein